MSPLSAILAYTYSGRRLPPAAAIGFGPNRVVEVAN